MSSVHIADTASATAVRISPNDTNYFVILFDAKHGIEQVCVVEIFTEGGATPPNVHHAAHEIFFVIEGEGVAVCDGEQIALRKGQAMLVPPGVEHVVQNTGKGKLYTLTTMCPNEGFAELLRAGYPVPLDDEDLRILSGVADRPRVKEPAV